MSAMEQLMRQRYGNAGAQLFAKIAQQPPSEGYRPGWTEGGAVAGAGLGRLLDSIKLPGELHPQEWMDRNRAAMLSGPNFLGAQPWSAARRAALGPSGLRGWWRGLKGTPTTAVLSALAGAVAGGFGGMLKDTAGGRWGSESLKKGAQMSPPVPPSSQMGKAGAATAYALGCDYAMAKAGAGEGLPEHNGVNPMTPAPGITPPKPLPTPATTPPPKPARSPRTDGKVEVPGYPGVFENPRPGSASAPASRPATAAPAPAQPQRQAGGTPSVAQLEANYKARQQALKQQTQDRRQDPATIAREQELAAFHKRRQADVAAAAAAKPPETEASYTQRMAAIEQGRRNTRLPRSPLPTWQEHTTQTPTGWTAPEEQQYAAAKGRISDRNSSLMANQGAAGGRDLSEGRVIKPFGSPPAKTLGVTAAPAKPRPGALPGRSPAVAGR